MNPQTAIALIQHLSALDWRPLAADDLAYFGDAGAEARIAYLSRAASAAVAELLAFRTDGSPLLAIIGGASLQLELHGVTDDGDPVDWALPIPAAA